MTSQSSKSVKDLNPRSQAVKSLEQTVLRCLQLIEEFEKLEPGLDWQDVPGPAYRKIIGNRYEYPRLLEEVYRRYKGGTLYSEVLDLFDNLPPTVWDAKSGDKPDKKRELKRRRDAIREIRKRLDQ